MSDTVTGGIEMKLTKGKKIAAVIAVVIVVIAVISVLCGIVYYGVMRSKYNNVVEMIKQGNYETAEEMLIDMNVIGTKWRILDFVQWYRVNIWRLRMQSIILSIQPFCMFIYQQWNIIMIINLNMQKTE